MKSNILLGLIVVLLNCSSPQSFSYTPTDRPEPKVKLGKRIEILPIKDLRPENGKPEFPFFLIPFIFCQTEEIERPIKYEDNDKSQFKLDLLDAAKVELESTKAFSSVSIQENQNENDFTIEVKILSTREKETVITYGLSIFGDLITAFGLPMYKIENELSLELKLVETNSNLLLFKKVYSGKAERYLSRFAYHSESYQFQNEIEIVQRMFPEISNDIVNAIAKK